MLIQIQEKEMVRKDLNDKRYEYEGSFEYQYDRKKKCYQRWTCSGMRNIFICGEKENV